MKQKLVAMALVVAAALGCSTASYAQLKFGIKAGIDVNSLHFNEKLIDSDNRAGFTGGVMMEFNTPAIGLGFDISAMYVRRDLQAQACDVDGEVQAIKSHRDYIEIPLNLKYKFTIPGVASVLKPFVTTGPSVAFLTSRTAIVDAYKNRNVDCSWNFGFGLEFISKIQLHASYALGLSNSVVSTITDDNVKPIEIDGKTRCWSVTAAWLF